MSRHTAEIVTLGSVDGLSFDAIRKGYELVVETPKPGETVFKTLGEYAIHQPGEFWQLLPAEQGLNMQDVAHLGHWATAEAVRTRAGEGTFLLDHMDFLETTLVRDQRVTNAGNRLAIASEEEVHTQ